MNIKKIKFILLIFILFVVNFSFVSAEQENKIRLSISPLLNKINIGPGETWEGSVEIFNSNNKETRFIISVRDFKAGSEGRVQFINEKEIEKNIDEGKEFLLSQWIDINRDPLIIPARGSRVVPFTIKIPENSGPGGKYAAILASVNLLGDSSLGTNLIITPSVGSLILLSVRGNVDESAFIREFSTKSNIYVSPEVPLTVRVQNDGNTHIHPRGDIKIYDQRDKVIETILINQESEFGNILPQSSRSWNFFWEGDHFFQIGKHKAVLTLVYGEEASHTISKTLYFWIFPINFILKLMGGVLFFLFVIYLIEYFDRLKIEKRKKLKNVD